MGHNRNRTLESAGGRRWLVGLVAAVIVATGLDLLIYGRPMPSSYVIVVLTFVGVTLLMQGQTPEPGARAGRVAPPVRLRTGRAWVVVGLGAAGLALAAAGLLAPEGSERALSAAMFAAAGLGNLAWGAGSLLPEGRGARAARLAIVPLSATMFAAMLGWVALQAAARLS